MLLKKSMKAFPFPVKQLMKNIYTFIPPRIRYVKVFWETYHSLQESKSQSREKLEDYQMQQLSRLLYLSYENVPYYRKIFDLKGLKPKDIQNFDDLKKLPFLTKKNIPNQNCNI